MSSKQEVLAAVHTMNASLRELEQAALTGETQMDLLIAQGRAVTKALGELTSAVGALTDRLNTYLDEQSSDSSLGARVTRLEREMRNAG